MLLAAGCASGPRTGAPPEEVESYVYARPLEEALPETSAVLTELGWKVQARGTQLATGWRGLGTGAVYGLRVDGERIDIDHCRIRIEGIDAVSLGPAIEDRGSRQGAVSGEVTAGSDRLESSNTLGSPPAGLVALPRGRDTALEWTVLQRLDPKGAQALERAATTAPAPVVALASASSPPLAVPSGARSPDCDPLISGAEPLVAGRRLVLLTEVRDTGAPLGPFLRALSCRAAGQGTRTVVVLDLLRTDQGLVDTYLAGQGSAEDRTAFVQLAQSFGQRGTSAGRSEAVLSLLDLLRGVRDAGVPIRVLLFDEPPGGADRDRARAKTVERVRRSAPDALVLVVVRSGASTPGPTDATVDLAAMQSFLDRWGLHPVTLELTPAAAHAPSGGSLATP